MNRHLEQHVRKWRNDDPEGIVKSNTKEIGSWHSPVNTSTKSEYAVLCQHIIVVATTIFNDLDYHSDSFPVIENMWANISPKYGFNRQHNHPGCLWSGVYYVHAPEDSGRLYFNDPRRASTMIEPRLNPDRAMKRESWKKVYFEPKEGRIVLFPSWLEHTVEPNLSNQEGDSGERISIAFNLVQALKE